LTIHAENVVVNIQNRSYDWCEAFFHSFVGEVFFPRTYLQLSPRAGFTSATTRPGAVIKIRPTAYPLPAKLAYAELQHWYFVYTMRGK